MIYRRLEKQLGELKDYDLIIKGSGSATNLLDVLISRNPKIKIAVIDKDEP